MYCMRDFLDYDKFLEIFQKNRLAGLQSRQATDVKKNPVFGFLLRTVWRNSNHQAVVLYRQAPGS